jgi:predicted  nucleic acid-binding Zn-ribbon protein
MLAAGQTSAGRYVVAAAAAAALLSIVVRGSAQETAAQVPSGIVDCLVPGTVRMLGRRPYPTPARPALLSASECTIRGGDFLLFDRANYDTSLAYWIAEADGGNGNPDAMFYVGEIYAKGLGRAPDFVKAAEWYQKAADAGHTTAMISLAHLYKTGTGVDLDLVHAQELYSRALGSDVELDPASVKGADQRVQTLLAEVEDITRQKRDVEQALAETNRQLAEARNALDVAIAGRAGDSELISELRAAIEEQEAELDAYRADLEGISAQNAELVALREQLEQQQIETARLEAMLDDADRQVVRASEELASQQALLETRQEAFDRQLGDATADRESLQTASRELEQQRNRIRRLEEELRGVEEERDLYATLADDAASQQDRVAALNARIVTLEQRSQDAEVQLVETRAELEAARVDLDAEIAAAQQQDSASAAELERREAEISALQAEVERAEQEALRHRADIELLTSQSDQLEQLRVALEREEAQSGRLREILSITQAEVEQHRVDIDRLSADREALEEEIAELEANAAAGDEASQALLRQREQSLVEAQRSLQALREEAEQTELEFDGYRQQMTAAGERQSRAIEDLRNALDQTRAERERLQERLDAANRELAAAQVDFVVEVRRREELQDELFAERARREANEEELDARQAELDAQSQQVDRLRKQVARLELQRDEYAAELDDQRAREQAQLVEFAGPRIILTEPSESLLASSQLLTRGGGQTRGVSVVPVAEMQSIRFIRGRVEAPAGLAFLTLNDEQVAFDTKVHSFVHPIELDAGAMTVRLIARDHNGKEDVREFVYRGDATRVAPPEIFDPEERFLSSRDTVLDDLRYYALLIANEDYQEDTFFRDLETPIADAEAIGRVLEERYGFEVEILRNATKAEIESALERVLYTEQLDDDPDNDRDAVLIYYAGHGFINYAFRETGEYYWVPVDARESSPTSWFETEFLNKFLKRTSTPQILVVADSCYAGNLPSRDGVVNDDEPPHSPTFQRFVERYSKMPSRWVYTSGGLSPVLDGGGGGHSVFARAFLDVLEENNNVLSANRFQERVTPLVLRRAEELDYEQTPYFGYLASAGHEFGYFFLPAPRYPSDQLALSSPSYLASRGEP